MTESPTNVVYHASAKPEQPKPLQKEDSKLVKGIKNAVNNWLERVGPKSVEDHFVKAHENVLATLDSDQRKEIFAKEIDKWKKQGKIIGVTATVIDVSLAAIGLRFSLLTKKDPEQAFEYLKQGGVLYDHLTANRLPGLKKFLLSPLHVGMPQTIQIDDRLPFVTKRAGLMSTAGSLGILATSGPGHWLAHLAAGGKEKIGKMHAKTQNYVDSGKAAEHAAKVGDALGKAATETAKWAAEHPDEIRKSVETVNRVKRENAESTQELAQAKQKAADIALEKEYQDWIAHHPDKAYYEQSGLPYPSKAEFAAAKARDAAAKKAAQEEEKRGEAK